MPWRLFVAAFLAACCAGCGSESPPHAVDAGVAEAGASGDDAGPGEETTPGCRKFGDDGTCASPLVHQVCFMTAGPACDTDGAFYPNGAIGYCCP